MYQAKCAKHGYEGYHRDTRRQAFMDGLTHIREWAPTRTKCVFEVVRVAQS